MNVIKFIFKVLLFSIGLLFCCTILGIIATGLGYLFHLLFGKIGIWILLTLTIVGCGIIFAKEH